MRPIDRQILANGVRKLVHNKAVKRRTGLYPLETLLLYVTMRCNAKCSHCFCWEDLNIGIPEMTRERYDRLAETMPVVESIVATGGEPTLRKDLLEVLGEFASRRKVGTVKINTNGLFPEKIVRLARDFKKAHPETGLELQLSLDGLEETHDRIRGVPGNFRKVLETLRAVWPLRAQYPGLAAVVLTVINDDNHKEIDELNRLLQDQVGPDLYQGFEIVRDVDRTAWNIPEEIKEQGVGPKAMQLPPVEAFDQIAADLRRINARSPFRADPFRIHTLATLEMIRTGQEQYPCVTAGQAVGVVYSNGDVAHCEFTLPFANLADFDHDFDALWHSDAADERRRQITGCHCTHGCFHGKAVEYSWSGIGAMARLAVRS